MEVNPASINGAALNQAALNGTMRNVTALNMFYAFCSELFITIFFNNYMHFIILQFIYSSEFGILKIDLMTKIAALLTDYLYLSLQNTVQET